MRHSDGTVEMAFARFAGRKHGVATRRELMEAGVTAKEIRRRLRSGALLREHPGVYRVGHRAPSMEATYLAAVLACGRGAVLCGRPAAHLLGLVEGSLPPPEVTCSTKRRIAGAVTHRTRCLDPRDAALWRGIRVTAVPRTLVDLAAVLRDDDLARACHRAGVRFRTTPRQVEAVLARRPTSPGAGRLRRVLYGDVRVTLSTLERAFLDLLAAEGLPLPETNRVADAHRVDCRWPEHRLTVALDSYRFHGSRYAWEADRRRERAARQRGDEHRRYTYDDV